MTEQIPCNHDNNVVVMLTRSNIHLDLRGQIQASVTQREKVETESWKMNGDEPDQGERKLQAEAASWQKSECTFESLEKFSIKKERGATPVCVCLSWASISMPCEAGLKISQDFLEGKGKVLGGWFISLRLGVMVWLPEKMDVGSTGHI